MLQKDCRGIRLKQHEKNHLADLVISKQMRCKDVAQQFNLEPNTISYYVYRRRKSSRNFDKPGGTRKIDEISHNDIINMLSENSEEVIPRLRAIIKEEGKKSYLRINPDFNNNDRRRSLFISHRTINRYYDIYI